jgi:hypothetical protein
MKQVFKNRVIKAYVFNSYEELSTFKSNQQIPNFLELDNTFGNLYICYICYDSLTQKKIFSISFSSDSSEEQLFFYAWQESKLMVVDTGREIYLIDNELRIVASFDITSPLIGIHVTKPNNLLVLEEASLKLIDFEGKILMNSMFDLIEEFDINDNILSIRTAEESKQFELK